MDAGEIQALVRQEVQNALAGLVKPETKELDPAGLNGLFLDEVFKRVDSLEDRMAGVEEDAWADAGEGDITGMGLQHLPPLCPMPQGGLDTKFREYKVRSKDEVGDWDTKTVGGGSATTLTASATNYCWLLVAYTRRTLGSIYQWGPDSASISITTSVSPPTTDGDNTVDSSSTNQTAILFATITTDSDKITGVEYHPFLLHQNPECALSITPLTSSSMTEITVVSDFRVDVTGKTFDVKTRTAQVLSPGSESGWTTKHTGGACP